MSKDPAILFYTSDFLTGTITMDDDQVGQYIKLLCLQHQKGRLSEKDMLKICGTHDKEVFSKFLKDDDGYYNDRMNTEVNKRKAYSESRRKNRASKPLKKETKSPDKTSNTYVRHMEDEDINENKDAIKDIIYPFLDPEFMEAWGYWKEYKRKEFGFKYKSIISEQAALVKLSNISENSDKAILIIKQSIENGWKGFFDLTQGSTKQSDMSDYKQELAERAQK